MKFDFTKVIETEDKMKARAYGLEVKATGANTWSVKDYTIVKAQVDYVCSCPYNQKRRRTCKHIYAVQEYERLKRILDSDD